MANIYLGLNCTEKNDLQILDRTILGSGFNMIHNRLSESCYYGNLGRLSDKQYSNTVILLCSGKSRIEKLPL